MRLSAAGFLGYGSYAICRSPLLPLFAHDLGAPPSVIGLIAAASTVTGIFVKLPAGAMSDVLGRRPLLVVGGLVFGLTPFAYLAVSTLTALIVLRVVHGCATAIFGPVSSAAVSDLAPATERGTWLGTYTMALGAGQAAGPLLAGYLIAAGRFELAFILAGVIGLTVPYAVCAALPALAANDAPARWPAFKAGIQEVVRNRLILVTSVAYAAQLVLSGALSAFLPLYGRDLLGLTTPQLGWLFAEQTLATLALRPLVGAVSDRASRRVVIVSGLAMCGMAVSGLAVASDVWTLGAAVMIYAAGVATTTSATSAFITDVSRRGRYGAAHGVFGTIYDMGEAAGPIGAGLLVGAIGYRPTFQTLAVFGVAMAVMFAFTSRPEPATLPERTH